MTNHDNLNHEPFQHKGKVSPSRLRTSAIAVSAAFFLGILVGGLYLSGEGLQAGVRPGQKREAFKSGGARSELVLKEISTTLLRIEKRMEKIEERMMNQPQIRK